MRASRCTKQSSTAATAARLVEQGFDIVQTEQVKGGVRVVLVLYPWQRNAVEKLGVDLELWTNTEGVTATKLAAQQEAAGFKVWRDYDGPDGIRAYLDQIAAANPDLLKLEVIGQTWGTDPEGDGPDTPRDIVALEADQGRQHGGRQQPPGGPLFVAPARPRVDQHRGQPAPPRARHQDVPRGKKAVRRPAEHQRALVRAGCQPRRVPVHVRPRPAVAEEPARQRRRQPDHTRTTASTPTATIPSTGSSTTRARRRSSPTRPTAGRPPLRNPKRRR